jgi:hypothetical protein
VGAHRPRVVPRYGPLKKLVAIDHDCRRSRLVNVFSAHVGVLRTNRSKARSSSSSRPNLPRSSGEIRVDRTLCTRDLRLCRAIRIEPVQSPARNHTLSSRESGNRGFWGWSRSQLRRYRNSRHDPIHDENWQPTAGPTRGCRPGARPTQWRLSTAAGGRRGLASALP